MEVRSLFQEEKERRVQKTLPLDICSMLEEALRKGEETIQSREQQPTWGAGKHRLAGHAELFIVAKALRGEWEAPTLTQAGG